MSSETLIKLIRAKIDKYTSDDNTKKIAIKYLKLGTEKNDPYCIFKYGCYCYVLNNYVKMNKLFNMMYDAPDLNNKFSVYYNDIINFYLNIFSKSDAEHVLELRARTKMDPAEILKKQPRIKLEIAFQIGIKYLKLKKLDDAEKYLLIAADKNHSFAKYKLAEMYKMKYFEGKKDESLKSMIKYYLMAIESEINNHEQTKIDSCNGHILALYNLGHYYENIKEYELMKKYYLLAIDKIIDAHTTQKTCMCIQSNEVFHTFGEYYNNVEKNYEMVKKYQTLGTEYGNTDSMYELALYYQDHEQNYDLTKKFLLMGVEKNNVDCMFNLGYYYGNIENLLDPDEEHQLICINNMIKYYLMAIEKNDCNSMFNLSLYYDSINDYNNMVKYLLLGVKQRDVSCILKLGNYYYNKNPRIDGLVLKYYKMALEIDNSRDDVLYRLGKYYHEINDIDNMKSYLLRAIAYKNTEAMIFLANFYSNKSVFDFELMNKYYLMALEYGNIQSAFLLASYFQTNLNFLDMIKWFSVCINHYINFTDELIDRSNFYFKIKSMISLGTYYKKINNMELMMKYYMMAHDIIFTDHNNHLPLVVQKYYNDKIYLIYTDGSYSILRDIAKYYKSTNQSELMTKFCLLDIEHNNNSDSMFDLGIYYRGLKQYDDMKKYLNMAVDDNNYSAMIELSDYYKHIEVDNELMNKYSKLANDLYN